MPSTIDSAGRLVIPSEVRKAAAIEPGTPLDIRFRDGIIEIEPVALPVQLVKRGRLLVAVPLGEVPTLTAAEVEQTREGIRRTRGQR